ncbi:hypothetical protein LCGC14_2528540, partial [marine sediment metagenome]
MTRGVGRSAGARSGKYKRLRPFRAKTTRCRFNSKVRPHLTNIPIGQQGIAFDRLELDAWVEDYISRNGRPGLPKGDRIW